MEASSSSSSSSKNLAHLYEALPAKPLPTICCKKLEAVGRIALAALAGLGYLFSLTQWTWLKEFALNQLYQGYRLLFPTKKAGSLIPMQSHINSLNHVYINSPEAITEKLEKEVRSAQEQMLLEEDKAFNNNNPESNIAALESKSPSLEGSEVIGVCSTIGRRSAMEDEHLAAVFSFELDNGEEHTVQLFGVFDGHAGNRAALFVKQHIQEQLRFYLQTYNPDGLTDAGIWNALKMTFVALHEAFREERAGTTVSLAIILGDKLWVANTGDSRAVLSNGGDPVQLSEDAKPNSEKYKKGIKKRGGEVIYFRGWTVNGQLAVARAIGDHNIVGINPRPKITAYPLANIHPGSHLVVACDGLWDVASTRQVVQAVNRPDITAHQLAHEITAAAYAAFSKDNLTVMVAKLG